MVDWQSQAELIRDANAFSKLMHALLGLYIWEWATSLYFDIDFITRKRTFRWPMIFYFANRYTLLFAMVGIAISLNVTTEVNCQALYTYNSFVGNASVGFASINLSLRTMAVWSQKWYIVAPLILVIMGHWSLLLHGILLKAVYIPSQGGCVITQTNNTILAYSFIYSMCFDFLVLVLTGYKLVFNGSNGVVGRSRLSTMIFGDGLIYFLVAFLANAIATTFMLLNLNGIMSIIANVPAAIASTIVACRAVRRLNEFTNRGPEVFTSSGQASTIAFRTTGGLSKGQTVVGARGPTPNKQALEGVHVEMHTYGPSPVYDAMGNIVQKEDSEIYDHEAQNIRGEFKRQPF